MRPSTTRPAPEGRLRDHPDRAAVLALVCAYERTVGAMPYALLRSTMRSLDALDDPAGLRPDNRPQVSVTLHRVVSDLRRLDLVEMDSSGTVLTSAGEAYLDTVTERDLVGSASAALRRLHLA